VLRVAPLPNDLEISMTHSMSARPRPRRASGSTRHPERRAAAAVEFAVVAPVLFLIILGMIEFGRVMMVEQEMTNAAREGCRTGVLQGSTASDVRNVVSDYLSGARVPLADPANQVVVSPDPSGATAGASISVTVRIPFDSVSWLPVSLFMEGKTLSATVVMRKESNNT
jgi:Flp pilus assembly protein TadG